MARRAIQHDAFNEESIEGIDMPNCYFCQHSPLKGTRFQRAITYDDNIYNYYKCGECSGYSMYPKLTEIQLNKLYSSDYVDCSSDFATPVEDSHVSKFETVRSFLTKMPINTNSYFLDYGCGANPVSIQYALQQGYIAHGMEISPEVREMAAINTGVKLFSRQEIEENETLYDVIFLGDVLEHLLDPIAELRFLKSKLKDNGKLVAQGPLQGSQTVLHDLVRVYSGINRKKSSNFPPYHVSLATLKSMKKLFSQSGFSNTEIDVSEVNWPAPTLNEVKVSPTVRNLLLHISKSIDKIISKLLPNYGSRYFAVCSKLE